MKNEFDRLFTVNIFKNINFDKAKDLQDIVRLAASICDTPVALLTLLDDERNNFIVRVGLELSDLPADSSFCRHTILSEDLLVINDTYLDERFSSNVHVVNDPSVRFYAGAPLQVTNGHRIGSLCVLDSRPKELTDIQRKTLEVLSRQAMVLMEYELSQKLLKEQIAHTEQRNKILLNISQVHSHDFRGPVASLLGIINIIREENYNAEREYLVMMEEAIKALDEKIHLIVEYTQLL